MKLNKAQRSQLAQILADIATAWYVGAVVAQFFTRSKNLTLVVINFTIGVGVGIIFTIASLYLLRKVR